MALTLSTVKVVNQNIPDGFMIVNESDLTDEMVLHDAKAETARRKKMKQAQAAAEQAAVMEAAVNAAALQAIKDAAAPVSE